MLKRGSIFVAKGTLFLAGINEKESTRRSRGNTGREPNE
jgi:hypothetical protein